jgi:hypothetical protein
MKTRQVGQDMAISVRINKEEWVAIKADGDAQFKNRNVGYMQVAPGAISFENKSPFFKEMEELDDQDKEKSDEQIAKDNAVAEEIKNKNKE